MLFECLAEIERIGISDRFHNLTNAVKISAVKYAFCVGESRVKRPALFRLC